MLLSLSIKNYALIESLEIDFSNKFSIITGETGAGKSILLGAIGLLLGNRADLSTLKDSEQKCIIEAHFLLSNYDLKPFFEENGLDYEDLTIVRREILPSGKSRAFINDTPVTVSDLQSLSDYLIDVHSQHETRALLNEEYQLGILDIVAKNEKIIESYKRGLVLLNQSEKELKKLKAEKDSLEKEQEYNRFLLDELIEAKLKAGEQIELESELEQLTHVELIKESLDKVLSLSHEEEIGTRATLNEIKLALSKLVVFSKEYADLSERISSVVIEFEDIVEVCYTASEKIIDDPERLEFVNSKLQLIYNLQKKHHVSTVEELIEIQLNLENKVVRFDDLDQVIEKKETEFLDIKEKLVQVALKLTQSRLDVAPVLSKKIETILAMLGMPDARLVFEIKENDNFGKIGNNSVELLFTANKGMNLGLVKKTASGGELSRIMLAIKAVLANYSNLPTIIFDEIDTGVSGEIANKMGEIMKGMSENMQVFAITHLPQIAAKGDQHYKVFKYIEKEETFSEIKLLKEEERVVEIAEMLSGKDITDSALNHAKALLN